MRPGRSRCGRRPAVRRRTSSSGRSSQPRTRTSRRSSMRCSTKRRSHIRRTTSPSGRPCTRHIRTWRSRRSRASARTYRRCWPNTPIRSSAPRPATNDSYFRPELAVSTPWPGSRWLRAMGGCGGLDGSLLRMNEKTRFMLALIAPAALVLVLFQVVPILTGANASFRDWTLHDPKRTWVGLANYIHVLRDQEFLEIVLPNTFGFMFASVALSLVLGLAIALMLNKHFPGRWLVQSFVLLPLMVAPVIAAIMIRWMFNDQFGVVNAALEGLGLAPISWLTQRWTTF